MLVWDPFEGEDVKGAKKAADKRLAALAADGKAIDAQPGRSAGTASSPMLESPVLDSMRVSLLTRRKDRIAKEVLTRELLFHLLFILLSPLDAGADHLKALAGVSRVLRNESIAERLRGAKSDEALYALLLDTETRDAA